MSSMGLSSVLTTVRNVRLAMVSILGALVHALQPVAQLRAGQAERSRGAREVAAGAMHRFLDQRIFERIQAQAAPHHVVVERFAAARRTSLELPGPLDRDGRGARERRGK